MIAFLKIAACRKLIVLLAFCLTPILSVGQTKYDVDSKHQIGISSAKFFTLFNESTNSLGINYRFSPTPKLNYRTGLSYEHNTAEDGYFEGAFKLGVDRYFKNSDKWRFYYGIDTYFSQSMFFSSERSTTKFGGSLLFGVMFHLGKHFSFSTEPNFSLTKVYFRDDNSFDPDANRDWFEFKLENLGHVQMNFHF